MPAEWQVAAALVTAEAILALIGVHAVVLSGAALLAPGLALIGLLPARVRAVRFAGLAAAPALGFAATSVALITVARVGIPLGAVSVRAVVFVLVGLGALTWPRIEGDERPERVGLLEALVLLGVAVLAVVLGLRVVGRVPVPGNDWAHYLLYADQVRHRGSLLIQNPFWMGGQPFREDPAIPATYGATLIMARASAGVLAQAILVFAVIQVLAVYAYVRAWWGWLGGLTAAALVAAVPASQDILGWEGVPNVVALALLALLMAYLAQLATEPLDRRAQFGLATIGLGLFAAHRSSATIGIAAAALVVAVALLARRRGVLRDVAWVVAIAVVVGAGLLADLYARQKTFGGTLPYTDYLDTKVNLRLAIRDLSWVLVGGTVLALTGLIATRRLERALWPAVALTGVTCALGYVWLLHLPFYYARIVYFLPVAAAPIVAAGVTRLPRAAVLGSVVALVGIAIVVPASWRQARQVQTFYTYADAASLRGLDALSARLRPGEVVVTDRCWSFTATWLLHTPTLAALEPQDIQPKAELAPARRAQSIISETPRGLALARRLGVRYLVVAPSCPSGTGATLPPPRHGTAVFASPRLAIIRLPRA